MVNTKFLDYDAREKTRVKVNPNNYPSCIKCQKLIRGKPKFYVCFLKNKYSTKSDRTEGAFPFILHPKEIENIEKEKLDFEVIGSDCAKMVGLGWCVKGESNAPGEKA